VTPILITLDFETAFGISPTGRKVTLAGTKGMSTEEYVRDYEFKVHGLGIKVNDQPARYYYGQQLFRVLRLIPWEKVAVLAHHTHFDGAILAWRCGIRPRFWLDTISMANAVHNQHPKALEFLAPFLECGEKRKELSSFKDKWILTDEEQQIMAGYCINDVELTYRIFQKLKVGYPIAALRSIDDTIRMFTEPQFEINTNILVPAYRSELQKKRALIKDLNVSKKQLNSNQQFAELLENLGVEVPMKISPTTKKLTFAFAKTDEKFIQLAQHPDPKISKLVAARLGVKTSIVETRLKRFYNIGKRGMLPVYLKPNSAHTKRWGGGDKTNLQNLSNRGPGRILRTALVAPKGKKVVVCDLSQIEARFLVWWAGQQDRVEMFRNGEDPYNAMASSLYGRPIDRKRIEWVDGKEIHPDKDPGAVGKATILGCIAEGQLVLTTKGLIPIQDITPKHLVWDGEAFVLSDGAICMGEKECITSGGLTATPDHKILTAGGDFKRFDRLAVSGWRILGRAVDGLVAFRKATPVGKKKTYDIINCGPRNRFCCSGIIVHNCGYGLGWFNFQEQLRVGFLGMDGIIYGDDYIEQLDVNVEHFCISRSYDAGFGTLKEQALAGLPNGMGEETHIKHCAVVWTIVNRYRELNPMVKALWKQMNGHIMDMILGREVQVGPFKTGQNCIYMPNGLTMHYPELEKDKNGDFQYVKEYTKSGKKLWTKLYGGKAVANSVQGACQILIADSITTVNAEGYPVALTVHDEIVCVPREEKARECLTFLHKTMTTAPSWCADLPLAAEGDIGDCYGDAK